jgi:hypothetical protein
VIDLIIGRDNHWVAMADVNHDTKLDLVVTDVATANFYLQAVQVFNGDGHGAASRWPSWVLTQPLLPHRSTVRLHHDRRRQPRPTPRPAHRERRGGLGLRPGKWVSLPVMTRSVAKRPWPRPRSSETLPDSKFAASKSSLPSPFMSIAVSPDGDLPTGYLADRANTTFGPRYAAKRAARLQPRA